MKIQWTNHLKDPEDKSRFARTIESAKPVLDRQIEIINNMEEGLLRSETSLSQFDTPNWDYQQAFKNGYRAGLKEIKQLIDLDNPDQRKQ